MNRFGWTLTLALAASALAPAASAQAQSCNDAWVTQTIREVYYRAPQGSGNSGECNINRYGGGQWSSYDQLKRYVNYQYVCADPWIAQAVYDAHGRLPGGSGNSGECNKYLYGANWSSYGDLKTRVQVAIITLRAASIAFDNSGQLTVGGATMPVNILRIVAPNGIVAAGSGNAIGQNGASLIGADGATLIGNDAGSLRRYGLQSTSRVIRIPGGSTVIIP